MITREVVRDCQSRKVRSGNRSCPTVAPLPIGKEAKVAAVNRLTRVTPPAGSDRTGGRHQQVKETIVYLESPGRDLAAGRTLRIALLDLAVLRINGAIDPAFLEHDQGIVDMYAGTALADIGMRHPIPVVPVMHIVGQIP
jgi:hypothetical protein